MRRRDFLKLSVVSIAGTALPLKAFSSADPTDRTVVFVLDTSLGPRAFTADCVADGEYRVAIHVTETCRLNKFRVLSCTMVTRAEEIAPAALVTGDVVNLTFHARRIQ